MFRQAQLHLEVWDLLKYLGLDQVSGSVAARIHTANIGRAQMLEFFATVLEERRKAPREDLISILAVTENVCSMRVPLCLCQLVGFR